MSYIIWNGWTKFQSIIQANLIVQFLKSIQSHLCLINVAIKILQISLDAW